MRKQVFIANIAWSATEDDIRAAFEDKGFAVEEVRIMKDHETQRSKGFGFVTLDMKTDTFSVVEQMHGQMVCGRKLSVEHAKGEKERAAKST